MHIYKIDIQNYRLLKDFSIDLEDELSLVIGKNNTGKTSLLTVLEKFLNEKNKFSYDDFNIDFRDEIETLITDSAIQDEFPPKGIKLKIYIQYDEKDDLSNINRVLMDLDPENNKVVLGFEYTLNQTDLERLKKDYKDFKKREEERVAQEKKNTARDLKEFLKKEIGNYFRINKKSFEFDVSKNKVIELNYVDLVKEKIKINDIINFNYISARRDVTNKEKENTLSRQTSSLYNKKEDNSEKTEATEDFKDQLSETDKKLSGIYEGLFSDVIKKVQAFGGIKINDTDISIISTLQHRDLLEGNTTVVYDHDKHKLPEHYNGLGYMNLISMIFEIEILVQEFKRDKETKPADINLLIIEEPEAHTHPQMQYIFIKNIKNLLSDGIKRDDGENRPLQYMITTHSSHIVADSDFNDIKYLKSEGRNNVIAKNLSDLAKQYNNDPKQYQFLKQYLTISRAEVFFADKAVLIEGDTERILIPTFMMKVDIEEAKKLKQEGKEDKFLPLLSQNISIIEVGAYSQIFEKFIEFLGIKCLIITDIDSKGDLGNKNSKGEIILEACAVDNGSETSNTAILHYLKNINWIDLKSLSLEGRIVELGTSKICLCYQQAEKNTQDVSYHARSFEDAFIHINKEFIKSNKTSFQGLKNDLNFENDEMTPYELAEKCIKKKTHFALDILYNSNEDFNNWDIPGYIKNGLLWLKIG